MNVVKNQFPIEVAYLDGSTGEVEIKLPPLRDMDKYLPLLDDDVGMVGFLTGLDAPSVDNLTDESVFAICDKAAQAMHPRVAAWVERQAAKFKSNAPLVEQVRAQTQAMSSSRNTP